LRSAEAKGEKLLTRERTQIKEESIVKNWRKGMNEKKKRVVTLRNFWEGGAM